MKARQLRRFVLALIVVGGGFGCTSDDTTSSDTEPVTDTDLPVIDGFSEWADVEEAYVSDYLGGLREWPCGTAVGFSITLGRAAATKDASGQTSLVAITASADGDPVRLLEEVAADVGTDGCTRGVVVPGFPEAGSASVHPLDLPNAVGWSSSERVANTETFSANALKVIGGSRILIVQMTSFAEIPEQDFFEIVAELT